LDRDGVRGLCLATVKTLTPSITVQSRFFAPTAGINEDPVTGSVHGPLAAYVVKHGLVPLHDGLAGLMCTQAKPGGRGGLVNALVQPQDNDVYAVRIGGRAVTAMRGTLIAEL
jgi:PhzF family phenazine biosynthesis protein